MKNIQENIGVVADGVFGPNTARAMKDYLKLSPSEAAHFLGQCVWESASFTKMREDFSRYTERNLLSVFGKYFTKETAKDFVGHPEKIANLVYANRMGNGGPESGDGYKFRGNGPLQLTGRRNHELFSDYVKEPGIIKNPELVNEKYPLESAKFYFDTNNIWRYCSKVDDDSILNVSRMVNLGSINSKKIPNHLDHRAFHTKRVWQWLK
jgi:putative chitinase